jgi:hypothetical protein
MKKGLSFFILLALFLLLGAVQTSAQERSYIAVKARDSNNGIVTVDVVRDGKGYRLTCNERMSGCLSLKNGRYLMVELPTNFGIYDCKDVEIYPEFAVDPLRHKKLGEFCLEEK